MDKLNYVIFFPDELRADALHCYGNSWTRTPNYDKLAAQGVRFDQCFVQNTVCSPSRCCMITGRYPHSDGHRSLWNLVKKEEKNLFRYLKEDGYQVKIFGKNDMFTTEAAELFTDEFCTYENSFQSSNCPVAGYGEDGYYNFLYEPCEGDRNDVSDYKNLQKGIEFINSWKPGDPPFILFLPLLYPHCPYTTIEPYYSMYMEHLDMISVSPYGSDKPEFHELIRQYRKLQSTDLKKVRAIYSGMVSFTDMMLGELMNCIEKNNRYSDTMLIVSSDHGDYAGDYGLVEKWPSGCEDSLCRVPLLIKAPFGKEGHVVNEIVELFDIMATILDTSNIEPKHAFFAQSLYKQISGEKGDSERAAFCEGGYNPTEFQCSEGTSKPSTRWMSKPTNIYYPKYLQQREQPESVARTVMIRTTHYKCIRRSFGRSELYDLYNDPQELCNLYDNDGYKSIRDELNERLLLWYLATSDSIPFEEDSRTYLKKRGGI